MKAVEENGTAKSSRVDSKVRFTTEVYEDLRQAAYETRTSFQGIIDEALRIWMQIERGKRPEFSAGMAAAAMIFHDAIADARRKQLSGKALQAILEATERFIDRVDTDSIPELRSLSEGLAPAPHSDAAIQYVIGVMEAPKNAEEEALAAYLRALASRR